MKTPRAGTARSTSSSRAMRRAKLFRTTCWMAVATALPPLTTAAFTCRRPKSSIASARQAPASPRTRRPTRAGRQMAGGRPRPRACRPCRPNCSCSPATPSRSMCASLDANGLTVKDIDDPKIHSMGFLHSSHGQSEVRHESVVQRCRDNWWRPRTKLLPPARSRPTSDESDRLHSRARVAGPADQAGF